MSLIGTAWEGQESYPEPSVSVHLDCNRRNTGSVHCVLYVVFTQFLTGVASAASLDMWLRIHLSRLCRTKLPVFRASTSRYESYRCKCVLLDSQLGGDVDLRVAENCHGQSFTTPWPDGKCDELSGLGQRYAGKKGKEKKKKKAVLRGVSSWCERT